MRLQCNSTRFLFPIHLKCYLEPNASGKMYGQCIILEFGIFPPKFKWKVKYFCDGNAWLMMHVLDSACQDMNVAKRTTSFGLMVKKLCMFEVQIHLAMIDPYLFNHTWEIHDLGLFGNRGARSSTFMLDKISFEAFLRM